MKSSFAAFVALAFAVGSATAQISSKVLDVRALETEVLASTPDAAIAGAIAATNQTSSAPAFAAPDAPISDAVIASNTSAVITDDSSSSRRRDFLPVQYNKGNIVRRQSTSQYVTVTDGTDPTYSTAAVQMPAYLTYRVYPNATASYSSSVQKCLKWCDSVTGCASVNIYTELGNPLLDHVFSEKSNLKCVLFGDIPTLDQMTNKGGQQLYPRPAALNSISHSAVYAQTALDTPHTPDGYSLVFGPGKNVGANSAQGYMGYHFLNTYDTDGCAQLCDNAGPDPVGGPCKYFNIWRGLVNGNPTTYTCSLYSQVLDASTATNMGDAVNHVTVTVSRGYAKTQSQLRQ